MNFLIICVVIQLIFDVNSSNVNNTEETLGSRIIKGHSTTIEQFPFQIYLIMGRTYCNGALLTPKWIVTAAHCVDGFAPNDLKGVAGMTFESELQQRSQNLQIIPVVLSIKYPHYLPNTIYPMSTHDLALLKVKSPFQQNNKVKPLGLDSIMNYNEDEYYIFTRIKTCRVAGWGGTCIAEKPSQLQTTDVNIHDSRECQSMGKLLGPGSYSRAYVCVLSDNNNNAVYFGDSGSPLVCNGIYVGLVSGGNNDCNPNQRKDGIFVRLDTYKQWIVDTINKYGLE